MVSPSQRTENLPVDGRAIEGTVRLRFSLAVEQLAQVVGGEAGVAEDLGHRSLLQLAVGRDDEGKRVARLT